MSLHVPPKVCDRRKAMKAFASIAAAIADPEIALGIEHSMYGSGEASEADNHVRALSRLRGELRRGEFLE